MSVLSTTCTPAVQTEAEVTRGRFGIAPLSQYALFQFTGPDAIRFLNNRLSNDVSALQPGQGQRNAVLDRQGKIQGILDLYRMENALWLMVDKAEADNAIAQIEKFHILENFQCAEQTDSYALWAIQGPGSAAFLETLLPSDSRLPLNPFDSLPVELLGASVLLVRRAFLGDDGFLCRVPREQSEAFQQDLMAATGQAGGTLISEACWEALRIEAGQPRFGQDYQFNTLLPETGLEREAVSYSKGCYLGQETIARVKTYGMLQQALVGLLFSPDLTTAPPSGAACRIDDNGVGTLASVVYAPTFKRVIAMAYLGKKERIPGKRLLLEIDGQSYTVEVCLLPFYHAPHSQPDGQALLTQGLSLFSEGQDEAAIAKLRQALTVQPDLLAAYEALGVILSRHEEYEEAIALMNQLLALDPDHVLAHTNLSIFYMKLGDKDKAEDEKAKATTAAFRAALRQKSPNAALTVDPEAERLKKEQALQERIAMFEEALKFNPEDPLGNFGLGSAYLELQQYAQAIEPFQRTLKAQPKHSVAYASLGKCLAATGQTEKAREILEQGIEVAAAKGDLMPLKAMQAHLETITSQQAD
ncbi:CAF17-like 4Fe-4S cluster assembly/insertion protein YgfZ [Vampirovibrio chlorellavorus]|uniref:CAF17-like 4Fe-4S cluster assembly/insertion protein YgfZ n=1 Tax=Vampirovibrio chlorellavorus TaxID=758823 RepID=UPI0026F2E5A9|nr:tetratricopeptide repeat protein [Vampirovibrio chlorellavorus]